MAGHFISIDLQELRVDEPLPGALYVYLDFRFITFRAEGDAITRTTFQRLELKRVRSLFIREEDRQRFATWFKSGSDTAPVPTTPEAKALSRAREDAHRKVYDIFMAEHPEKMVSQALEASKKLVDEVMKIPYAVKTLSQLQSYSKGTVDHSVNVSALSVYLAMQMGYSHQIILQHVGTGALLHDIGKTQIQFDEEEKEESLDAKMKEHPSLGAALLESQSKVPNEVKMIVAQHHEAYDGSGYPKKLRGSAIYDLARIVSIANVFDEQVGASEGSLLDRQRAAIKSLDEVHFAKFDPQKLDKALKILKLGV